MLSIIFEVIGYLVFGTVAFVLALIALYGIAYAVSYGIVYGAVVARRKGR